jgi:hypothetical protein
MGQKYTYTLLLVSGGLNGIFFYSIVVEFAKESRPRREPYEDRYGYSQLLEGKQ